VTTRPDIGWRVRLAGPGDVPAVTSLESEVFEAEAWSARTVEAELLRPDRVALVATGADAILGYLVFMVAGDMADLNRIAVVSGSRRRGVAAALLEAGLEQLRARGVSRVLLEVSETNEAAIRLYTRAGFREVARRRRYYRDGADAVVLELPLTEQPPRPT
jgi:ribosomal-protein-alanine N-acetyltransferase